MGTRGPKSQKIQLTIGNDPKAMRYASLAEALHAALPILIEAMSISTQVTKKSEHDAETPVDGGDMDHPDQP